MCDNELLPVIDAVNCAACPLDNSFQLLYLLAELLEGANNTLKSDNFLRQIPAFAAITWIAADMIQRETKSLDAALKASYEARK